jgi:hypothetical protein
MRKCRYRRAATAAGLQRLPEGFIRLGSFTGPGGMLGCTNACTV